MSDPERGPYYAETRCGKTGDDVIHGPALRIAYGRGHVFTVGEVVRLMNQADALAGEELLKRLFAADELLRECRRAFDGEVRIDECARRVQDFVNLRDLECWMGKAARS